MDAAPVTGDTEYVTTTTNKERKMRDDIHRPSLLDPAEYEFAAAFYQGASDAMYDAYRFDIKEYETYVAGEYGEPLTAVREGQSVFQGNYAEKATCDHCGAHFNHGVLFLHKPTGDLIHVGHICASDTIGLPSRAAATRRNAEKAQRAAAEREARVAAGAAWRDANSEVVTFLANYGVEVKDAGRRSHPFLDDMVRAMNNYGSLTDGQTNAVRKFIANDAKFEAARKEREEREAAEAPTTPLVEGRREITGTIVSAKFQDSDYYGSTPKMLVKEPDGNKVWGTIPEAMFNDPEGATEYNPSGIRHIDTFRGETVTFTAAVTRSRDDEHFGFFKRPTGAKVTRTYATEEAAA